jgi:DNA-directed RNA polymerase alpha subunit
MAKQSVLRVFEVYQSNRSQQWGWRAKSFKNKKITFTGESHPSEAKAIRAIQQELTALGATNPVRIDVISGLNKRDFVLDTMAPLNAVYGSPVKELYLVDMSLSTRTLNALKVEGVETVSQLVKYRREELGKLPNIGSKAVTEIEAMLETVGGKLAVPPRQATAAKK